MSSFFALIKSLFRRIIAFFKGKSAVDEPEQPAEPDPRDIVCYYGCPNSKKARKLQLEKKPIR